MMSRTVISDTDITPSIIDSGVGVKQLCARMHRQSWSSSSRSSGSRVRNADSRSSSVVWIGVVGESSIVSGAARQAGGSWQRVRPSSSNARRLPPKSAPRRDPYANRKDFALSGFITRAARSLSWS